MTIHCSLEQFISFSAYNLNFKIKPYQGLTLIINNKIDLHYLHLICEVQFNSNEAMADTVSHSRATTPILPSALCRHSFTRLTLTS